MADNSQPPGSQLALALFGGLCAIPAFVFLTSSGGRFSLIVVDWRECWLGLPSWQGIPVPLALPIVLVLMLAAWHQTTRAANPLQPRTRLLLGLGLLLGVGMIVVTGAARGIQLLLPLAVLVSLPLAIRGLAPFALVRGWCLGAGLFLGLQLAGLWWDLGTPLLLSYAAKVSGGQGAWAVGSVCRFWGACIYQAFVTVPDLALSFATVCGVCGLQATARNAKNRCTALIWGAGWLIGMISAWNSGRSSVLLVLLLQLVFGVVLFIKSRSSLWMIPGLSLACLALLSLGSLRPVVVDRLLVKFETNQAFDREEIWQAAAQQIARNPEHLLAGNHAGIAGTHSLFGDILLRVGLPLTLLYLTMLAVLIFHAYQHMQKAMSPSAQAGLLLLLAIPLVQNLVNASLLQPFSFLNTAMGALALAFLV